MPPPNGSHERGAQRPPGKFLATPPLRGDRNLPGWEVPGHPSLPDHGLPPRKDPFASNPFFPSRMLELPPSRWIFPPPTFRVFCPHMFLGIEKNQRRPKLGGPPLIGGQKISWPGFWGNRRPRLTPWFTTFLKTSYIGFGHPTSSPPPKPR